MQGSFIFDQPYRHRALPFIIAAVFFRRPNLFSREEVNPFAPDSPLDSAPYEIPPQMLILACYAVCVLSNHMNISFTLICDRYFALSQGGNVAVGFLKFPQPSNCQYIARNIRRSSPPSIYCGPNTISGITTRWPGCTQLPCEF